MRSMYLLASLSLGVLAGAAALTAGCFSYQTNCADTLECNTIPTGTGGVDGGPPPGCDPATVTGPIGTTCGIFVSPSGNDANPGSQILPLKTLSAAVAKGGPIYACQGTTPYTEAVTIGKAVTLYGALDCTKWTHLTNQQSQLTAAAGMVPLTLTSTASGTAIHDFAVTAVDATAAGGSSIAILDDSAALTLAGVDVSAGKGAAGTPGAMPPAQVTTPATANGGNGAGDMACTVTGTLGGGPGINSCNGTSTNGGVGGQGVVAIPGSPGTGGTPMSTPSNGGAGQGMSTACGTGLAGTMGTNGAPGMGAQGIGDVSASGYEPVVATMGATPGGPGQGGGGGGSAIRCSMSFAGPSGGGGGAGGCGGAVGVPGTSGGSSIGIVLLNATLTMTAVNITTHAGGAGGVGGDGQVGGNGGTAGAAGGSGACGGGPGGQGGVGGGGGGGAGGHSVGIALKGGTAAGVEGATISYGMAGSGASAGNMDTSHSGTGDDGFACKTLDFGNPMSAMACVM